MSKISDAFIGKKAFIPFITGGDPDIPTTEKLIHTLAEAGADIIEIGIPFSDPVAEGPVIEAADERALKNGFSVDKLFTMIKRVRETVKLPLLFMTYYNPVFGYGAEKFCKNAFDAGINGLIVPDLPYEESGELRLIANENGLELISLIAPTSKKRIEKIAKNAEGFLYCVSSLGVTGIRSDFGNYVREMIETAKIYSDIPCAVGFGISNPEQAKSACEFADGVIIGSAIVKICAEYGTQCVPYVKDFAASIVKAIK
ncbi:MAG: tryptophan synthase subunit alpha [Ruminococcus sp.]|jgi:tryptophan synthase alpha chain|nr:tryptophan synthase subunit alpha [Ruminococcus sp.]